MNRQKITDVIRQEKTDEKTQNNRCEQTEEDGLIDRADR